MVTKAQVIERYLIIRADFQKLLDMAKELDEFEMIEFFDNKVKLIDMFIEALNRENPTQEELQSHFNKALSSENTYDN